MRLLLISNSTQHGQGYLQHCAQAIRDFLEGARPVVFIPYALRDWDSYTEHVRDCFAGWGLELRGVHETTDPVREIEDAPAVFTGGGNTFRLLHGLYDFALIGPLRERVLQGCPYMGSSAGSNVACPTIKTTNDMPIVYPPSFDALGLVPFNINPHYLDPDPGSTHGGETREQRIREFHEMNTNVVVGLREGSWLERKADQLLLHGLQPARIFRKDLDPAEYGPGSDLSFLLEAEG